MRFRTEVEIPVSEVRLGYRTPVMFIGSCFAQEIAGRMTEGAMPAVVNPSGVVYNPCSVATTLDEIIGGVEYTSDNLWFHNGRWLSFHHYTTFSSPDKEEVIAGINRSLTEARAFLRGASSLFVTFGTARIYRRSDTGEVVSNCHKIPPSFFERELLSTSEIVSMWSDLLDRLTEFNPLLNIFFTVSPVRHWKDGAHGNQISKSVLFLAIEELMKHPSVKGYFPSYEIMMDDLRDYRFYATDMLHPSEQAVDYIWVKFRDAFIESADVRIWNEVSAINKAARHRFVNPSPDELKAFSRGILGRIEKVVKECPYVDLTELREYFENLS